ncbi:MAG: aminotransferase class V-fold PLP-dependent enzyme [Candidatus Nanopelagicales bacterium]|jgi:cysteine desulfurase|nr:aminotransferase class V-fold PLP-dependent enzyme [Candidatus Nanopelagicales bacterium]
MSRSFDAASGMALTPAARRALAAALDRGWADPTRLHRDGRVARQLLDAARASVAERLGALPQEVTFTGSGTEALHLAVLGLGRGRAAVGTGVVASAVEHSAVLRAADWVAGGEPVLVPVDTQARLEVEGFAAAVAAPGVAVACVQQANHEVGTLQPLAEAHAAARAAGVPLVVDACAALGHVAAPSAWDVLAGSAHKWGGPAGVGVLAIRTGVRWRSPVPTDEAGRRAGFPDVPAIVAAATALEEATAALAASAAQRSALVGRLRAALPRLADDVVVLGPDDGRLPHLTCCTVLYADGEVLVTELDRAGFAVSSGSACTADTRRPSHVLAAMGAVTHGNLRVSLPPGTTEADVDAFLAALPHAIAAARDAGVRAAGP